VIREPAQLRRKHPVIPVIEKTPATAAEEGVGDARQLKQLLARAVAN
jgi:ribonuclease J